MDTMPDLQKDQYILIRSAIFSISILLLILISVFIILSICYYKLYDNKNSEIKHCTYLVPQKFVPNLMKNKSCIKTNTHNSTLPLSTTDTKTSTLPMKSKNKKQKVKNLNSDITSTEEQLHKRKKKKNLSTSLSELIQSSQRGLDSEFTDFSSKHSYTSNSETDSYLTSISNSETDSDSIHSYPSSYESTDSYSKYSDGPKYRKVSNIRHSGISSRYHSISNTGYREPSYSKSTDSNSEYSGESEYMQVSSAKHDGTAEVEYKKILEQMQQSLQEKEEQLKQYSANVRQMKIL